MVELKTVAEHYPLKPKIFKDKGKWKAVCNLRTPRDWILAALVHVKKLEGKTK